MIQCQLCIKEPLQLCEIRISDFEKRRRFLGEIPFSLGFDLKKIDQIDICFKYVVYLLYVYFLTNIK